VYAVGDMTEFIDEEILEMAIARELDANRFYINLALRVKDTRVKKIFKMLAAEELEHKAKIELEIMKAGRVVGNNPNPPEFRRRKYGYASGKVEINYKEILLIGLKKEEESIQLYVDLAEMTSDAHSKEVLLALANEEAGHKQRFQNAINFLSMIE
jgi:rubrerythrin